MDTDTGEGQDLGIDTDARKDRYTPEVVLHSLRLIPMPLLALAVIVSPAPAVAASPVFKIYVEHTGVYEVPFERLAESGLDGSMATATMGLRNLGRPVPVWIEDGGDGRFDPGDRILFVGETLRGEVSYLDPYSRLNCYVLDFADPAPWLGADRPSDGDSPMTSTALLARHHLEPDRVMVRFRTRQSEPEEEWYWERLSVADKKPFEQELVLDGLVVLGSRATTVTFADALSELVRDGADGAARDSSRIRSQLDSVFGSPARAPTTVVLRFGLRGWSEPRHRERASKPEHEVEILLNGAPIGTADWDGTEHNVYEIEIPATRFVAGANQLALTVPKRLYPESGDLIVDVVLLNWIEMEYEHVSQVGDEQLRLRLADPDAGREVVVTAADDGPVDLYLPGGVRVQGRDGIVAVDLPGDVADFSVLRSNAAASPNDIVLDRPSDLRSNDHQADYIMITHRSLRAGAERLADFHRSRGLAVDVVDVQDIYDEFNYGIVRPQAIKDFLQHAFSDWRAPKPRFVLLVGDASWDFKNATADDSNYADWTYRPGENRNFWKNRSTTYAEGAELNHRNLVPTSSYLTLEGHAASDTWFVCFDDGDTLPDMAIGRIPVVEPEELDHVIDKTIAFASDPPVGPWRRNLLFIANESDSFQRRSDKIADEYLRRGYVPIKIYPHPSEPANEHHTRRIIETLDAGVYAVHFIGHGGRYIWRTGPPDLAKNHDLFTLEHLDQLAENRRLPVVLSLTCYSAPFDHPTADSIGEKLLRIADRGAIAVFAASWRNSPSPLMGESLLAELTTPGNTIGEAVMRAKYEFRSDVLVQTYNLLGDPAVPVSAPSPTLDLELEETDGDLTLRIGMPTPVGAATLLAEWVAADGSVLREDRLDVSGSEFDISLDPGTIGGTDELLGVRAYVWDESLRIDGIGWVGFGTAANEDETGPTTGGNPDEARSGATVEAQSTAKEGL